MEATVTDIPPLSSATAITKEGLLPKITASTSPDYMHHLVEISSHAFATDPLRLCFECERRNTTTVSLADIAGGLSNRITAKLKQGASILEAGDWAAAACWEPPELISPPYDPAVLAARPIFAGFLAQLAAGKRKHLGSPDATFWHLSMMARDPRRSPPIRGAVRALLEPYLALSRHQRIPVWVEASSPRARDVYAHFGFRELEVFWTGAGEIGADGYRLFGGPGVPTWLMIYDLTH